MSDLPPGGKPAGSKSGDPITYDPLGGPAGPAGHDAPFAVSETLTYDPTNGIGQGRDDKRSFTVRETRAIQRDRATLWVFFSVIDVVLVALLMFYALSADKSDFATVVMGPLLTILAGAAGFYFGRQEDGLKSMTPDSPEDP
jgi:hypothetical protein